MTAGMAKEAQDNPIRKAQLEDRISFSIPEEVYPAEFGYVKERAVREKRKSLAETACLIIHEAMELDLCAK